MTHDWHQDDYSWIRGANYVPSYAANDVTIWRDFDAELVDRELGYAEKLGLNSVRIFLQYLVWQHYPERFRANFEKFLELCDKHKLKVMPVIFDSCFGEEPEIDWNGNWVMNPGFSRETSDRWPELEGYVDFVVGEHVGDERIVMWDVMNEPASTRTTIIFVRHWLAVVRKMDPTHPTTIGVAGNASIAALYADHQDVLGFHSYMWPESLFHGHIRNMRRLSAMKKKPILLSETGHLAGGQPYEGPIEILNAEKIGWYFWELMIASSQFNKWQGIVYPDGTIRDAAAVAGIMGVPVDEVPFEVKPDAEGIPYERGNAVVPPLSDADRKQIVDLASTPASPENLKYQMQIISPRSWMVMTHSLYSEEEVVAGTDLWRALHPKDSAEPDMEKACAAFEKVKASVIAHLDEVDWAPAE